MKSIYLSVSLVACAVALAQPAFAQEATPCADANANGVCDTNEQAAESVATQAAATDDAIVVVGSRLRRDTFNSPSPVQVVTREMSTDAGLTTTAEILQSTAVTGGQEQINNAFGGYVTNGGPGANTLSLRGLGATRSLILLNGRRVSPAGSRGAVGSADLNTLPTIAIGRYEILKDGASSIYGSDAVAGVVNAITRTKVEGFEFTAGVSAPEVGAGSEFTLGGLYGTTGDRFNLIVSAEYYQRAELTIGDKKDLQCQTQGFIAPPSLVKDSGSYIDPLTGKPKCWTIGETGEDGVTINTIGTASRTGAAALGAPVGARYNRWRPNTAVTTGLVGFEGVGGTGLSLNIRDTFEPRMLQESLISPTKNMVGYLQAGYDTGVLGDGELYVEAVVTRRKSKQTGYRQLTLDYGVDDALLLPTNLRGLPAFLAPTSISNGQNVAVRAFIGAGLDTSSQKVDTYKVGGGLRGNFVFPGWRYDAYFSTAKSDATYTMNSFLSDRLAKSMDVTTVNGAIVCKDTSGGCIAAPVLTNAVIGGQLPQDWYNYVFRPVTGTTKFKEDVFSIGFDGNLIKLPYGDAKLFIGGEMRWDSINDTPSIESQNGTLYNLTSSTITRGKDSVKEIFGEIEIPVLKNLPFAQELTLNASARYTDYKSYGGDYTYKIAGLFTPIDALSFRASYGTSFRAPALFEQYLGATSGFLSSTVDPCDQYGSLDPTSTVYKNCVADGLPIDFEQKNGVKVLTVGGADAGLKAETSKNFTAGAVFQPKLGEAFGDFKLAVDYYKISVSNGVARLGGSTIANLCYDDPQFRAGGGFCSLVNPRGANNELTVRSSYVNIATDKVSGLDYNVRYARDIGEGRLRLDGLLTQYLYAKGRILPTDPVEDSIGLLNSPKWSGALDASFEIKEWRFNYGFDWIKGTDSTEYLLGAGTKFGDTKYDFKVGDYMTHYASIRWKGDDFVFLAGVRNLFDAKIPQISAGSYNRIGNYPLYSGYDYVGRTFYANITTNF